MIHIVNFIRKYWIIFAIVALYFVLAGLNLLPRGLNIFKKKHLLINDTPVVVKEIREIGELITAEYYGEVYADLNEVYDDLINFKKDSIIAQPALFYNHYSGLEKYMKNYGDQSAKELEYRTASEHYDAVLNEHLQKLSDFKEAEKQLNDQIAKADSKRDKRKLEKRLKDLSDKLSEDKEILEDAKKEFNQIAKQYREERFAYWESRKQRNLVYIGRGWVKAGINFKDVSENDIIIDDSDSSTIQILISDPTIINADINPWFIYTDKKKVKGFEVFIDKTGSMFSDKNFTDKEVTQLKIKCKDKLKQAALEKGLLKNAKKSAVKTLEDFFHLVGFKNVIVLFRSNTVVVHKNKE